MSLSSGLHAARLRTNRDVQGDLEVRGTGSTPSMVAYRPPGVESECLCFHKKDWKPRPGPVLTRASGGPRVPDSLAELAPPRTATGSSAPQSAGVWHPQILCVSRSRGPAKARSKLMRTAGQALGFKGRAPMQTAARASARATVAFEPAGADRRGRAAPQVSSYWGGSVTAVRKSAVMSSSSCSLNSVLRRLSSCCKRIS